jgi:hypothetical protein
MSICFAKERERSESSIYCARDCSRACDQAAAHVPLPVITMSKSPVFGTKNHYPSNRTPLARQSLASGVGAVYRRAVSPRQPKKTLRNQEFLRQLGIVKPHRACWRSRTRSETARPTRYSSLRWETPNFSIFCKDVLGNGASPKKSSGRQE